MKTTHLLLVLVIVSVALAPAAGAQATRDVVFRGDVNADGVTFVLGDSSDTPDVTLPAGSPIVWATQTPIAVGADLSGHEVTLDLYLADSVGSITARYGSVDPAGQFTPMASSDPMSVGDAAGTVGGVVTVGHAQGTITLPAGATIPSDGRPAIELVSTDANTLYTEASILGSASESSATIPLPELSSLLLFATGAVVVGLVWQRRRA